MLNDTSHKMEEIEGKSAMNEQLNRYIEDIE